MDPVDVSVGSSYAPVIVSIVSSWLRIRPVSEIARSGSDCEADRFRLSKVFSFSISMFFFLVLLLVPCTDHSRIHSDGVATCRAMISRGNDGNTLSRTYEY